MQSYVERDKISREQLVAWAVAGVNVLIYGNHGVGKSSMVRDAWDSMGIKGQIFSGSTLDPWVDFIGVPKLVIKDGISYIEMARPQTIDDNIEAICIDEYNRSPAAVRNAVLELIQFKSINGRKFPNLKVVWAMANPKDSSNNYDVEEIDPAQEDRFQVIVKLSDKPNLEFFNSKFGADVGKAAVDWHTNLSDEIRSLISPRRLEYAVSYLLSDLGPARDVFPDKRINISLFTKAVKGNFSLREFKKLIKDGKTEEIKKFLNTQSKKGEIIKDILGDYELSKKFIEYGNVEEIMSFASSSDKFAFLTFENRGLPDIKESLSSFSKIHGVNPSWYEESNKVSLASKTALNTCLQEFPKYNFSTNDIQFSNQSPNLSFKSPENIIDEAGLEDTPNIYPLNEESAINILDFFTKIDFQGFSATFSGSPILVKSYSLIYSAFHYFYSLDANLVRASFYARGCEKLARSTQQVTSGSGKTGGGRRSTGGSFSSGRSGVRPHEVAL